MYVTTYVRSYDTALYIKTTVASMCWRVSTEPKNDVRMAGHTSV